MDLFVARFSEKKFGIKIQPCESQLAILISIGDINVLNLGEFGNKTTKLGSINMSRYKPEVFLLSNLEI